MGKAADQRRNKRMKYLVKLGNKEPESFKNEWEKRLCSWIELIQRDAGRLKYKKGQSTPPVFDRVDEAMFILRTCGDTIFRKYAKAPMIFLRMNAAGSSLTRLITDSLDRTTIKG